MSTTPIKIEVVEPKSDASQFGEPLTNKERLILLAVFEGRENHEIEERLSISRGTLKNYFRKIYAKFGIHSQRGLFPYVIAGNFELRTGQTVESLQ